MLASGTPQVRFAALAALNSSSGQEEYDRLRPLSYPQTDVFLLVFNVAATASLDSCVFKWWPEVSHHCPNVPIILVGAFANLREDEATIARLQAKGAEFVSPSMISSTLDAIGPLAVKYVEVDFQDPINVRELMEASIRAAVNPPKPLSKEELVRSTLSPSAHILL